MADAIEYSIFSSNLFEIKWINTVKEWKTHGRRECKLFTVPSGSMSSKCFGVCACNPVSTYWPGLPCDSRTKKSPSWCNSASAAVRLIDAWNHSSVSSCERCTSAVNENGSAHMVMKYFSNEYQCVNCDEIRMHSQRIALTHIENITCYCRRCCVAVLIETFVVHIVGVGRWTAQID